MGKILTIRGLKGVCGNEEKSLININDNGNSCFKFLCERCW